MGYTNREKELLNEGYDDSELLDIIADERGAQGLYDEPVDKVFDPLDALFNIFS